MSACLPIEQLSVKDLFAGNSTLQQASDSRSNQM